MNTHDNKSKPNHRLANIANINNKEQEEHSLRADSGHVFRAGHATPEVDNPRVILGRLAQSRDVLRGQARRHDDHPYHHTSGVVLLSRFE